MQYSSPNSTGTKEYFDQVEQRRYFVEPHIPAFAEFAKWRGKKVLEIGCGIGTDTVNFARADAIVTAVDLSGESQKLAVERAEVFAVRDRISFYKGNSEKLRGFVPIEQYDLVYSFGVIHHTPQPNLVVSEICKYMGPDSELRIMLYSKISYKLFWVMRETGRWKFNQMDELVSEYSEAQTGCPVTYSYTFDDVKVLLGAYEIIDITKAHIFTWDVDAYRRHEWKTDSAWEGVDKIQPAQLEKELGWHTLVRATLAEKH